MGLPNGLHHIAIATKNWNLASVHRSPPSTYSRIKPIETINAATINAINPRNCDKTLRYDFPRPNVSGYQHRAAPPVTRHQNTTRHIPGERIIGSDDEDINDWVPHHNAQAKPHLNNCQRC